MLIFCHLCIGTILGILLAEHFKRRMLLPVCMIGSLLPDIIDKPIGYLILPELGDGRLIAHSLIGLLIIGFLVFCLSRHFLSAIACAIGIASHQVLDTMWRIPVNWFFPFLGPFPAVPNPDYFGSGLMRELSTPSEWAFFAAVIIILWGWCSRPESRWWQVFPLVPGFILLGVGR